MGKKDHYYYECNNGEFLNITDGLVNGFDLINKANKD